MLAPGGSPQKHAKKCVFGVFLNFKRIALVRKNRVIDIALKSGARGRIQTFPNYHLIIDG